MKVRDASLRYAIEKVGTAAHLARLLGVTPQAVSQWKRTPALKTIAVEALTGLPRQVLRPDLYPPDAGVAAAPPIMEPRP